MKDTDLETRLISGGFFQLSLLRTQANARECKEVRQNLKKINIILQNKHWVSRSGPQSMSKTRMRGSDGGRLWPTAIE